MPVGEPLQDWPCVGRDAVVASAIHAVSTARRTAPSVTLVRAPLGGGRSRCLEEIGVRLTVLGRTVHRIQGTSAATEVPFVAVAHLLPPDARATNDPVALIGALRDVLVAGDGRPTVLIDDLPALDRATAGVIAALHGAGEIDLVAAARDGETVPEPLLDIVFAQTSTLVDLAPLTEQDIAVLMREVLAGPIDGAVVVLLRRRTGGNPLFLREVTRSALDAGALARIEGVWRVHDDLPGSAQLRELVLSRLDVAGHLLAALELLTLCDSADVRELEGMVGLEGLALLESRGLLRVVQHQGREVAALARPMVGEAIRMALPALRSRLLLRNHVAWVDAHLAPGDGDDLQHAIWCLDAALPTDLQTLLGGARLAAALQDSRSVLRLTRPAFELHPTAEAGWLVGDALFQIGRWDESMDVLAMAEALPAAASVRVDLAVTRSNLQLWGLSDTDGALRTLIERRAEPVLQAENRARLSAEIASVLVYAGRPADARAELEAAAHSGLLQLQLGAAVSLASSLTMAGRTAAALAVIDDAIERRPPLGVTGVADVDSYLVAQAFARVEAGDLAAAHALAAAGYERAVVGARPLTQFWLSLMLGRVHTCTGAVATGLHWYRSARALGLHVGLTGPVRVALYGCVVTCAALGDLAGAEAAWAEIDELPEFGFMAPERALANGALAAARGDLTAARRCYLVGVDEAIGSGHITSAVWLLHEVARLGGAAGVDERISALADATDSPLAAARALHVRAMVTDEIEPMQAAAEAFEAVGARLNAAEACVAAADMARVQGMQRSAAGFGLRAEQLMAHCEGAISPGLVTTSGSLQPLTDREREIAFMAVSGLTSREIAGRLVVSQRTVSNHLQHIYDKLGVRNREDLRRAMTGE